MQRRNFFKVLLSTTIATTVATSLFNQVGSSTIVYGKFNDAVASTSGLTKPKRLKAGNTIGLIAPGSNVSENVTIEFAADILKSFGFKVKYGKNLFQRYGYLAGHDEQRAADVNAMFADDSVDGIFCLRGGYGSPRILPYLDYEMIAKNPKVFIGYSDITALLNAITTKCNLITFHGPIAEQSFTEYTLENFKKILFNPQAPIELATPPVFEGREGLAEKDNRLTVIREGKATGQMIGGNLSLLVKLVGTPYEPDYQDKILIIEDVEEAPYRIDGMLTHLWLAGRLQKVAGIVFGKCTKCRARSPTLSIEQVLNDRLASLGVPVLRGLMIGHIEDMSTLPIGANVTLDTAKKRLFLNETAVV